MKLNVIKLKEVLKFISVLFLGSICAYLYINKSNLIREPNKSFTCLADVRKVSFKINPSFYLNKRFLKNSQIDSVKAEEYIQKHLRYMFTSTPSYSPLHSPKFGVVPYDGVIIRNIKIENSLYPIELNLSLDGINENYIAATGRRGDVDSSYLTYAMQVGRTQVDDTAIKISYEAELQLSLCESSEAKFSNTINLPVDPFLAFWFISPKNRVNKHNSILNQKMNLTACSSDEFLNDYDPYYYWYYWKLDDKRCYENLPSNAVHSYNVMDLKELGEVENEQFSLNFLNKNLAEKFKMSVNLTLIDDDSLIHPEPFDISLRAKINEIIQFKSFEDAKKNITNLDNYDISLQTGLVFSWSLAQISSKYTVDIMATDPMYISWKLKGKFKNSNKEYEIDVNIGSAMKDFESYDSFYKALVSGIATSDIVYFRGHSGAGKNLSKERIQDKLVEMYKIADASAVPNHQLVFLMSCFSLRYFPANDFPFPSKSFTRDFIYTASTPSSYSDPILIGLINQVADHYYGRFEIPFNKWPSKFKSDVFLVHKRVSNKF